jgi:hypothetical protein
MYVCVYVCMCVCVCVYVCARQYNKRRALAQTPNLRPYFAEDRARSLFIPYEICVWRIGTETNSCFSTSVFSCQFHCTIAPYSSSTTCCSYQKDKLAKTGKLQAKGRWIFSIFWVITQRRLVKDWCFGKTYQYHLHGWSVITQKTKGFR